MFKLKNEKLIIKRRLEINKSCFFLWENLSKNNPVIGPKNKVKYERNWTNDNCILFTFKISNMKTGIYKIINVLIKDIIK